MWMTSDPRPVGMVSSKAWGFIAEGSRRTVAASQSALSRALFATKSAMTLSTFFRHCRYSAWEAFQLLIRCTCAGMSHANSLCLISSSSDRSFHERYDRLFWDAGEDMVEGQGGTKIEIETG